MIKQANKKWVSRRWTECDYTSAGGYFVTICTAGRASIFGELIDQKVRLTAAGEVVSQDWRNLPNHFAHVRMDDFVIMPNHLHGILIFDADGPSLGTVIGGFKAGVSRKLGRPVWQRYFYDHVIRSKPALDRIRIYIGRNPMYWPWDSENSASARLVDV